MKTGFCVQCGANVEGCVEGVVLTICCQQCSSRRRDSPSDRFVRPLCVSKTKARTQYKCQPKSLEILHYALTAPQPKNRPPTKLYIRAEVQALKSLSSARRFAESAARRKEKKIELEQCFGVDPSDLNFVVQHFLFGDYLSQPENTNTTRETVAERLAVLGRVLEIVRTCPGAHPEAVFDFCLKNPGAGPQEFRALKTNMHFVFRAFGAKILHKLPNSDVEKLCKSALDDVYTEFIQRDSKALIRGHLLQMMDEHIVSEIMEHSACQQRIERGGDEFIVAQKLVEFWKEKDDSQKRRQKLIAALDLKQLPQLLLDLNCCELYINGELDSDLEAVIGAVELEHRLRQSSGCFTDSRWKVDYAIKLFEKYMYVEKFEYNEAIQKAFTEAGMFDSDYDSDYSYNYYDQFSDDSFSDELYYETVF